MIDLRTRLPHIPFVTSDLTGTGGTLKQRPEDFLVEEIPLYEPCGEGEHIYIMIEKRAMATFEAMGVIAHHFGVRHDAVGYAGLKDKHAITRQVLSVHVPGKKPEDFPMLRHDRMSVLWVDLHTNKLRQGHLKGNRFSIKIRGVDMSRVLAAKRVLDRLSGTGVPNAFGEQRFGALANNHDIGRALVLGDFQRAIDLMLLPMPEHTGPQLDARRMYEAGDYAGAYAAFMRTLHTERTVLRLLAKGVEPKHALRAAGVRALSFFVSSWQSSVFNDVLARRISDGTFATLCLGDVAMHQDSRNTFSVDQGVLDAPDTAPRLASCEIGPSGPMWGPRMRRASGAIDSLELESLHQSGVTLDAINEFDRNTRDMIEGARRPLRITITDIETEGGIDEHGHYVRCAFDLPRGAFATNVMREVIKPTSPDNTMSEDE
ncbi:MAG: tRNA pseudouridine(13) synthase TruD [Phycisphaeraceae bacterium]|nr:tRNA pseudouridine(13) synthase TruD [Phycisphaeraceae bacterium]MCW5767727.1 tRNA pseudouridine(13) synthase TruD [Phycisphaeraceae bacterium]